MAIKKQQVNAAASYLQPEEPTTTAKKEKKKPVSIYIEPSVYETIKELAHYKQTSAGKLICNMMSEYLDDHAEELKMFRGFYSQMERINNNLRASKAAAADTDNDTGA